MHVVLYICCEHVLFVNAATFTRPCCHDRPIVVGWSAIWSNMRCLSKWSGYLRNVYDAVCNAYMQCCTYAANTCCLWMQRRLHDHAVTFSWLSLVCLPYDTVHGICVHRRSQHYNTAMLWHIYVYMHDASARRRITATQKRYNATILQILHAPNEWIQQHAHVASYSNTHISSHMRMELHCETLHTWTAWSQCRAHRHIHAESLYRGIQYVTAVNSCLRISSHIVTHPPRNAHLLIKLTCYSLQNTHIPNLPLKVSYLEK